MPPIYAYFLPQFYSTPENDKYWGKGFTEWTNVKKAKPLFEGHKRPLLPIDGDYYDLSDPETVKRVLQNTVDIGLDGVAYWYYWFGEGKKTLDKVPNIHLRDLSIKQHYFFAWANAPWTLSWIGKEKEVIFNQYYNVEEIDAHIDDLLPYFQDERYIKLNSKPLYQLNNPLADGAIEYVIMLHERFKEREGIEIAWIFPSFKTTSELSVLPHYRIGFPPEDVRDKSKTFKRRKQLASINPWKKPVVTSTDEYIQLFKKHLDLNKKFKNFVPTILSGWDTTYRYQNSGSVISGTIKEHIISQTECIKEGLEIETLPFIMIKAYNEWAEGNILENYELNGEKYDLSNVIHEVLK
ncbi:MAG: glycoside hydrolase family 99-like domain-containing protein [Balneola sp.]